MREGLFGVAPEVAACLRAHGLDEFIQRYAGDDREYAATWAAAVRTVLLDIKHPGVRRAVASALIEDPDLRPGAEVVYMLAREEGRDWVPRLRRLLLARAYASDPAIEAARALRDAGCADEVLARRLVDLLLGTDPDSPKNTPDAGTRRRA